MNDSKRLIEEANRFRALTHTFNSIYITDMKGVVLSTSPELLNLVGTTLTSAAVKTVIEERKPYISPPFLSTVTNRLIVTISHPIMSENGDFLGILGGTIYLREGNFLDDVLGHHFYEDGSYVYVVDEQGNIIYHQLPNRINDNASSNPVVQYLMSGKSGKQLVTNTQNQEMLAGYAYIPTAKWGVVSQRSLQIALLPLNDMLRKMILYSLPVFAFCILLAWILSIFISRPLNQLANVATLNMTPHQNNSALGDVKVWYYEGIHLKKVLDRSLGSLNERVQHLMTERSLDPLTKLLNRRSLDLQLEQWAELEMSFSVIMLDIDHFKKVNDTYGHPIGDEVLKFLAEQILDVVGNKGLSFRYGGEEFCLLIPGDLVFEAYEISETLRKRLESTVVSAIGHAITISVGIASYPHHTAQIHEIIDKADQALYEAKKSGRNQTKLYQVS